jgi:hypothetical protein
VESGLDDGGVHLAAQHVVAQPLTGAGRLPSSGPRATSPRPLPKRIASATTTPDATVPGSAALLMITNPVSSFRPAGKWNVPSHTQPLPTR